MSSKGGDFRAKIDPSKDPFDIAEWPFYHLARVTSIYSQRMDASLKPIGIDVPRWRVLTILHIHGKATITQLSAEAVTKMSTMAKIVQRMTAEKLVEVATSAEDARSTEVVLAPRGKEILSEVQSKVSMIGRVAFQDISDDEIRLLNGLTRRIYANLSI